MLAAAKTKKSFLAFFKFTLKSLKVAAVYLVGKTSTLKLKLIEIKAK